MQAVEESLGTKHPMYSTVLSSFAEMERLSDQKPAAVALFTQAVQVLDDLGPSHVAGKPCLLSPGHVCSLKAE